MAQKLDPHTNYEQSMARVGYVPRSEATPQTYSALGFKCGLEIHQQVKTAGKLFCRCPAGVYHDHEDFDAEVIRHMRPTLSELGEYDGTALMEFRTRKNITYRLNYLTACTYEIDDTPPFAIDREALDIAIEIALLLKTNIVGELHITRKQYLDGSIPTGFQRTAIVGIEGAIPLSKKNVGIIQLSIEEDSCREVADVGHERIFNTDRLGMPLIEMVTYPDMLTPDEAAEAGHYLRFLARSTGKVRTGIGAGRQDTNVSITGGTRVEIKGVARIAWIPELTHIEAFRQKALLEIAATLGEKCDAPDEWCLQSQPIKAADLPQVPEAVADAMTNGWEVKVVNLPGFRGLLSFFTQPGKVFLNELSDRLKVIACLEKPNVTCSEPMWADASPISEDTWAACRKSLSCTEDDSQLLIWGPADDMTTALETIEERCRLAFDGVPNETRKPLSDGTTLFERVLPGADRMYPDTDSAPIPVEDADIEVIRNGLPPDVSERQKQLAAWKVPEDTHRYLLSHNLLPVMETIVNEHGYCPRFCGTVLGHTLKNIEGTTPLSPGFDYALIAELFRYVKDEELDREIIRRMLPVVFVHPNMVLDSVLTAVEFKRHTLAEIMADVGNLDRKYREIQYGENSRCGVDWIMGRLRPRALGNIALAELSRKVEQEVNHV
jgi:glutamyl-tRNA(Gln) amidotransferase subunit E